MGQPDRQSGGRDRDRDQHQGNESLAVGSESDQRRGCRESRADGRKQPHLDDTEVRRCGCQRDRSRHVTADDDQRQPNSARGGDLWVTQVHAVIMQAVGSGRVRNLPTPSTG